MQAEDNGYYLKLDENGEYAMWGCYYAHAVHQALPLYGRGLRKGASVYLSLCGWRGHDFLDHCPVYYGYRLRLYCAQSHGEQTHRVLPDCGEEKLAGY